jgi:hypothetical protein
VILSNGNVRVSRYRTEAKVRVKVKAIKAADIIGKAVAVMRPALSMRAPRYTRVLVLSTKGTAGTGGIVPILANGRSLLAQDMGAVDSRCNMFGQNNSDTKNR